MVKMIPDLLSQDIRSQAEARLFREFRDYNTTQRYIILHSLALSEHVHNIFGEIDFVVISSKGVLCIEVKGGEVSCNGGVWSFTNRYGKVSQKTEGPFQQVQGNMHSLRTYLLKRLGRYDSIVNCQYASCVIMPDCIFSYSGIEIIPEILFDRNNYCGLDEVVNQSFAYWKSKLREQYGFEGSGLSDDDMDRLSNLLRGDFRFVPLLKDSVDSTTKALASLTNEQYDVLESLADNDRTLVSGIAGTGKTWLAMEQARRIYWSGKSVLYVCYNRCISDFVKYQFAKECVDIDVATLHSVMLQGERAESDTKDFFEQILPNRFIQKKIDFEYDYLIVDEGQDLFRKLYLMCLGKLLKGGLTYGSWLIFYDQNQNLFNNNNEFDLGLSMLKKLGAASYKLTVNCRNTKQIADANTLMTGVSNVGRPKVNGLKVNFMPYDNKDEERRFLEKVILELRSEGLTGSDFIVLSRYAMSNPKHCLYNQCIPSAVGIIKKEGEMWRAKSNEVRVATISSFKGLEAKVIILIDVDGFADQQVRLLNYVAVSRASSLLYVLYDCRKEQERQNMIVKNFMKL